MKKIMLLLVVSLFICSTVSAEVNKWKDRDYNFIQIKTVTFNALTLSPDVQDQFAEQKVFDIIQPKVKKLKTKYVSIPEIVNQMGKDLNIDLVSMWKTNDKDFGKIYIENIHKYADVVVNININQMGWMKEYVPPYSYTIPNVQTSYINGIATNGLMINGAVQTMGQTQISVPGGYQDFPVASISISIYDNTTQKLIYGYTDWTSRKYNLVKELNPDANMRSVIDSAFDDLPIK